MKFLSYMVVFGLVVVLTGFLLIAAKTGKNLLSNKSITESKPGSIQETRFFRVYLNEIEIDHKIIISTNEDEPKYEKGYVIVGIMDGNDYERLLNTGFEI